MRFPSLTRRRAAIAGTVVPVLLLSAVVGKVFVHDHNFRMTSPNLYRSGQLSSAEWQKSFERDRYRSVLNLRGAKPNASWYQTEMTFAADHSIAHYDMTLSASVEPTLEQMKQIVAIMRDAPKPILVHCKNGSDRSGLAAALYLRAIDGLSPDTASGQLSLWYGHFPWLGKTGAMDSALSAYLQAEAKGKSGASVATLN